MSKQLIIKLNIDEVSDNILDNFVLNFSKILQEMYPEIKIPEEGWEICEDSK